MIVSIPFSGRFFVGAVEEVENLDAYRSVQPYPKFAV